VRFTAMLEIERLSTEEKQMATNGKADGDSEPPVLELIRRLEFLVGRIEEEGIPRGGIPMAQRLADICSVLSHTINERLQDEPGRQ
jgi:hypothetical protein